MAGKANVINMTSNAAAILSRMESDDQADKRRRASSHSYRVLHTKPIDNDERDDYWPCDSHAKLHARNEIQTYAQRRDIIFKRSGCVPYRAMSAKWRLARFLYITFSFGGAVPEVWDSITSSATTVVAISITGVLTQLQTATVRIENNQETMADVEDWIVNFFQIIAFACAVLFSIELINMSTKIFRRQEYLMNEARFKKIMREYGYDDDDMPRYLLEYDSSQDADVAMLYFSMREEKWAKKAREANSFAQIIGLWITQRCERWCVAVQPLEDEWAKLKLKSV